MTKYSIEIIDCLASWSQQLQNCNGDPQCIEQCSKELRKRLDTIFPPATKLGSDNDKISYIFSTIFFLSNRLNKALIGLAETDKAIKNLVSEERVTTNSNIDSQNRQEFENVLNNILSEYY